MNIESPYLTPKEAARYLRKDGKYGHQVILRLVKAEKINAHHDGRHVLFTKEDLDAYLQTGGSR